MTDTTRRWVHGFSPYAAAFLVSFILRNANAVLASHVAKDIAVDVAEMGLLTSGFFLVMAVLQLPLGGWLDRFGPRRVVLVSTSLMAVGAAWSSAATTFAELAVARTVAGVGAAPCLMAAYVMNRRVWPGRVALFNGLVGAMGGVGAMLAGAPLDALAHERGWRFALRVLAGLACAMLLLVLLGTRDIATPPAEAPRPRLRDVLRSPAFWRVAPLNCTALGTYHGVLGLWVTRWLLAHGSTADAAVTWTTLATAAMVLGYGVVAWLTRRFPRPEDCERLVAVGAGAMLGAEGLMVAFGHDARWSWLAFGAVGPLTAVSSAIFSEVMPASIAGRAATTLNTVGLLGAFFVQAVLGFVLRAAAHRRLPDSAAFAGAFVVVIGLQGAALLWFLRRPQGRRPGSCMMHIRPRRFLNRRQGEPPRFRASRRARG